MKKDQLKKKLKEQNKQLKKQKSVIKSYKKLLGEYEDLSKRMNREEVTEIVNIVKDKIEELADQKGVFEAICCGSYRRFYTFYIFQ